MVKNTALADEVLQAQIELFKTGDLSQMIAEIEIIKDPNDDRPMWNWSLRNRLIMKNQGSFDSRNSNEWKKVGRAPRDWKKTVRILKPNMAYCHAVDKGFMFYDKSRKEYSCKICNIKIKGMALALKEKIVFGFPKGYAVQAEYDVDNTYDICGQGKLKEYKPAKTPTLTEFAKSLGFTIRYQTDPTGSSYGHVRANSNVIILGTEEPTTFYHELVHKIQQILDGKLKGGQDPQQEIIAELTGSVLAKIYNEPSAEAFSFRYIESYAEKQKLTIDKAINKVLPKVQEILKYIMEESEKLNKNQKGFIEVSA